MVPPGRAAEAHRIRRTSDPGPGLPSVGPSGMTSLPTSPAPLPDRRPVLVGYDGSAASMDALDRGITMARALDVPLHVLTAWEHAEQYGGGLAGWTEDRVAREILDDAVRSRFGSTPPVWLRTEARLGGGGADAHPGEPGRADADRREPRPRARGGLADRVGEHGVRAGRGVPGAGDARRPVPRGTLRGMMHRERAASGRDERSSHSRLRPSAAAVTPSAPGWRA